MNNFLFSLILTSLAGFSTLIGSLLIFVPVQKKNIKKFLIVTSSFSLIVMLYISMFDLIPEALKLNNYSKSNIILIAISLILSIFIIKNLSRLENKYNNNLYKLGIISMILMMLHNIPEGIITFLTSTINTNIGIKLAITIAVHNIPEGVMIAVPIYYGTASKKKAISKTFTAAFSEVIGAILCIVFSGLFNKTRISIMLIFVACLMITFSIEEIFPSIKKISKM